MKHRDFVIVSSINWTENWQIHQQLATTLVKSGHRVLFIENTGVRPPRAGDLSRIYDRLRNWLKSTRGFFDIRDNLTVFSPIFLPFPYSRLALFINRFILSRSIEKWAKIERFQSTVVISFLPTPLAQSLIKDIDPLLVIYYCADDISGRARETRVRFFEDKFLSDADSVFCTSHALLERAETFNKKTYFFPAGVDYPKFEAARNSRDIPEDLAALPKPIVGYVGAISAAFDQALLLHAAQALPNVCFVLVGPVIIDVSLLKTCANIKLLGMRPHDDIPQYIRGFDVALIPSINTPFTDAVYSCKLNEYMAMGVQVVATDMRELRYYIERHGNVLEIARTPKEFAEKIRRALFAPDKSNVVARTTAAQENGWDKRFEGISRVIDQLLSEKSNKSLNWQTRLTSYYRRGRMKMIKMALVVCACYGGLFYTPILWYAGNLLVMRDQPTKADAIVVFSGDGDPGYVSMNYQSRAQDALVFYRAKLSKKLLLSSGKGQEISEAEVVRALLLENDVPASAILVIEKTSKSTAENVQLSAAALKRLSAQKIIFITAPYHSRRAHLTWKKLAPELDVATVTVVDTPGNQPTWHTSHDMAKVIAYEYLVIAYYWWKGWL
jgi:glycosyltransferase involved in cell wall biosynthesis/uncharacterized SAM-binding protein YcdF (DUF218 family)